MITRTCKHCGKEFETHNPQQMYCKGPHFRPCPICGTPVQMIDNDFSRSPRCCSSECAHAKRKMKFKTKICVICGEPFTPTSGVSIVCKNKHFRDCEICGKPFKITLDRIRNGVTTCSKECTHQRSIRRSLARYGTEHPMQNPEVQQNFHNSMISKYGVPHALLLEEKIAKQQVTVKETNMNLYGVPYACMLPQCQEAQGHVVSKKNLEFFQALQNLGCSVSLERRINSFSYDICLEETRTLIELDPTYTHSCIPNHWGVSRDKYYHRNKTENAEAAGYRCVHLFDWDDLDIWAKKLAPAVQIPAEDFQLFRLNTHAASEFLENNDPAGTHRGQLLCLGLVKDGQVYQVMTFGKPSYDSAHTVQLCRMATRLGYEIVGGYDRLSRAATEFGLYDIIAYADRSKYTGEHLEDLGMVHLRDTPPRKIWSKNSEFISSTLLQSGKCKKSEEDLRADGWLPVYDCGQRVYEFRA